MRPAVLFVTILAILSAHANTIEDSLLADHNNVFRPDSLTLCITNSSGSKVAVFRNSGETKHFLDFYEYELIDYIPEMHYWVVEVSGYEFAEWRLVNEISGFTITAISPPIPSPDRTRLLFHMEDIMACYIANGIEIWIVERDSLTLEFSNLSVPWGPINGEWQDSETIIFEKLIYDYTDSEYKTSPGILRLDDQGVWQPEFPEEWKFVVTRG